MKSALIAATLLTLSATLAHAETVVRIGHAGPLTGPIAHIGKDGENGARLAIEDANARGLTIGGAKVKFELVGEDDQADPRQATTVAQRLADEEVSGVVGHVTSGASIPASRIYAQAGIPVITPSATNPKLTRQGYKVTFLLVGIYGMNFENIPELKSQNGYFILLGVMGLIVSFLIIFFHKKRWL